MTQTEVNKAMSVHASRGTLYRELLTVDDMLKNHEQNNFDVVKAIENCETEKEWVLKAYWLGGMEKDRALELWQEYWYDIYQNQEENEATGN